MDTTHRPPCVIVDRDGTTASCFAKPDDRGQASWAAFNAALPFDAPVPEVIAMLHAAKADGAVIVMVSGRAEGDHPGDRRRRFALKDWIAKHAIPVDHLFMRSGGDQRRDSIVKEEILLGEILPRWTPILAIDDRPQVIEVWERHGIPVVAVVDPEITPPIALQS